MPGIIQVAIPYVGMNLVRERGDVGDGDRPLVCVAVCGFACKPELQRAMQKRLQVITLGVPWNSGRGPLQLALPGSAVGVQPVLVVGQAGMLQRPLEAFAGDLDGEDGFLAFLGALPAAIHHPEE